MTKNYNKKEFNMILYSIDDLVPQDHFLRKYDEALDWSFIYPLVEDLYSKYGKPSVDPIVLFKIVALNYVEGIHSIRKTCERCKTDLAYRWFLGLNFEDKIPDHSTFSQNMSRKFMDTDVFEKILIQIVSVANDYGFIDAENTFIDSTHVKANANKKKHENKTVKLAEKIYKEELIKDINEDRIAHDKKPLKEDGKDDDDDDDTPNSNNTIDDDTLHKSEDSDEIIDINDEDIISYDKETGEVIEKNKNIKYKNIKVSTVDPESGYYHKGEHEKVFAYSSSAICDKHGFVLATYTTSGNIHDSVSFHGLYENYKKTNFYNETKLYCLDAGYASPSIEKAIIDDGKDILVPYIRPKTKKGFFKKYEYVYDEKLDIFICPNNEDLIYKTTNKDGYRLYESNPNKCINCPFRENCTSNKNYKKTITQHVWWEYQEIAHDTRHTLGNDEIYAKRKETIERVFADGKENFGLRFTRYKGIKRVHYSLLLTFAFMNLKKLAILKNKFFPNYSIFEYIKSIFLLKSQKHAFLSTI